MAAEQCQAGTLSWRDRVRSGREEQSGPTARIHKGLALHCPPHRWQPMPVFHIQALVHPMLLRSTRIPETVTVCVTSRGRLDLLAKTLSSFGQFRKHRLDHSPHDQASGVSAEVWLAIISQAPKAVLPPRRRHSGWAANDSPTHKTHLAGSD